MHLPDEIYGLIIRSLDPSTNDEKEALMSARLVNSTFEEFATPILFRTVAFGAGYNAATTRDNITRLGSSRFRRYVREAKISVHSLIQVSNCNVASYSDVFD